MAAADKPWDDLEQDAEALLRAEAERLGCDLRQLGILSARRVAHIKRYEVPLSLLTRENSEDEDG